MTEKIRSITEGTVIPLSLVLVLIGGIFWLSTVYSTANTTMEEVKLLRQKQDDYYDTIEKIDVRLSRIEGKLGIYNLHEKSN